MEVETFFINFATSVCIVLIEIYLAGFTYTGKEVSPLVGSAPLSENKI